MANTSVDPLQLIIRLAVAVMTADGRVTAAEIEDLRRFERLGLGPVDPLIRAEIEHAMAKPIDVHGTCAALARAVPDGAAVVLAALVDVALADREISTAETEVLKRIASLLGIPPTVAVHVLEPVLSGVETDEEAPAHARTAGAPLPRPPAARSGGPAMRPPGGPARSVLPAGAARDELDAAYLAAVKRYDPLKVIDLGPEFVVVAVRKLAELTAAYESAASELAKRSAGL